MSNFNPPSLIPALEFLSDCLVAITENEYRIALERAQTGLEGLLKEKATIDAQDLISGFYMVILHLGSTLEKAYGDKWEQLIPEITEDDKPMRCSFCGKNHTEVENLIAGPKVYICNECVGICNQVLDDGTDSRAN